MDIIGPAFSLSDNHIFNTTITRALNFYKRAFHESIPNIILHLFLDNCTEGEIRLVDGLNEFQGIVEVCILSTWSTISDEYIGGAESTTICRQLGYTGTCMPVIM